MYSQCMESDGKSTGLWVSTLGPVAKAASRRMGLDYLPFLGFPWCSHGCKEDNLFINPYLVLAAFLPHCASSKPCWVLLPRFILRGCFFWIVYEKSGNKQCFQPQTCFATGFWRAVWLKWMKCKTLFAKLLEIWDKHFHPADLNHRCPWKSRDWVEPVCPMIICWVTVCVAEALQERHLEQRIWRCFMEGARDLQCGTPVFHHENRHLDCWGFQLTVVLSSVCDIEQKSPKQADTLVWFH